KEHFGRWKKDNTPVTRDEYGRVVVEGLGFVVPMGRPSVPGNVRNVYVVDRPGAAQSVIRISFPLPLRPKDLRAQQAQVMNTILGGGIFNARLMQNLREKNGYTYGCYSSLDVDRFNSSLVVTTSVRTEVTKSAVAEILIEMERMRNEPVTKEELILAKHSMMGAFGRSLEDPRTVARFALNTRLNDLPADHYETYLKRLDAITAEQVQEAATAFLHPNAASILVVGELDQVKSGLAPFSTNKEEPIIRLTVDGERWKEELEPVTDRTAEQIIETYIYTVGGRDAIAKLRDLEVVRKETGDGPEVEQTEWFSGERYRMRRKEGAQVMEEITYNGERALISGEDGSGELTDAGLEMVQRQSRPVPEVGFEKLLSGSRILGSLTEGDREVYKLQLTMHSGNSIIQFYDKASGLKVREVESQYFNGKMNDRTLVYGDWRAVGGVQLPHRITESGGIRGTRVSEVS
ncbi:MAG TPA: insulinase family protein, partial [Flavobacteriales bacterium]|nr:insulinase family protein [Flavobacteriales bacterium]